MKLGKLTLGELQKNVIDCINIKRKEVLLGAKPGEDCAVLDTSGSLTFLTTDPITASKGNSGNLGYLAVNIACNDIAGSGAEPVAVMMTVLMCPDSNSDDVKSIMESASKAANELNVDIVGGHTEFTDSVNRNVVVCTAVGKASRIIESSSARVGDDIIVTKSLGLEGTAIIASDFYDKLKELDAVEIENAKQMLFQISVVKESKIALKYNVSAMHDITEGGVLGAVAEVCACSNTGAELIKKAIPVSPITDKICRILKLNPMRLLSSGSMLITVKNSAALIEELNGNGIPAVKIGKITDKKCVLIDGDKKTEFTAEPDEINKI